MVRDVLEDFVLVRNANELKLYHDEQPDDRWCVLAHPPKEYPVLVSVVIVSRYHDSTEIPAYAYLGPQIWATTTLKFKVGDLVVMTDAHKNRLRENDCAEHVDEFGECIGAVIGPMFPFLTGEGPIDVRWWPSGLRYGYTPTEIERAPTQHAFFEQLSRAISSLPDADESDAVPPEPIV